MLNLSVNLRSLYLEKKIVRVMQSQSVSSLDHSSTSSMVIGFSCGFASLASHQLLRSITLTEVGLNASVAVVLKLVLGNVVTTKH